MASRKKLGIRGEKIAEDFLVQKGFRICARNWRYGHQEIDLIALEGEVLVFVEVKARQSDAYGWPEQAVGSDKQRFLTEAAEQYVQMYGLKKDVRFDVIAITFGGSTPVVRHFRNAFYPTGTE
ncbi:MAG: YraN family protein [Chitinophagales bacterium]|nr:YraN family protein [Chitinophagales bacterium]MDW8394058.1 YraN family protein [Chitinophagales bacterium]